MAAYEEYHVGVGAQLLERRLRMEEQEDRDRRTAVRIKGLPGDREKESLLEVLASLFYRIMADREDPPLPRPL